MTAQEHPSAPEVLSRAVRDHPVPEFRGRRLLREQVYATLQNWIVDGVLEPGLRLRDHEIATAMEVSRTPVREALRRLQDEGLVEAEASRWTKVAPVDIGAADRIYPIIWTLEGLAVENARQPDLGVMRALEAANRDLRAALDDADSTTASNADATFHRLIVALADNPELNDVLEELRMRLRRIEIAYFGGAVAGAESIAEHEQVITALQEGDMPAAKVALEQNWQASLMRLRTRFR